MIPLGRRLMLLVGGLFVGLLGWGVLRILLIFEPTKTFIDPIEGAIYKIFFRSNFNKLKPTESLIVVDVQDEKNPNQKITRLDYARLIRKIAGAEAKVIGVDIFFKSIDEKEPAADDSLIQAAKEFSSRLVFTFQFGGGANDSAEFELQKHNIAVNWPSVPYWLQDFNPSKRVSLPFARLLSSSDSLGLGHVTYYHDTDNMARRFPMVVKFRDGFYSALAFEMVRKYWRATYEIQEGEESLLLRKNAQEILEIPIDHDGDLLINFIPFTDFQPYSSAQLTGRLGNTFKDKIVLIVKTSDEDEWTDATPLDQYPEWAIHASLISQLLAPAFIDDELNNTFLCGEILVFLAMIWLLWGEYRFQRRLKQKPWIILLGLSCGYIIFAFVMFNLRLYLLVVGPLLVLNMTYITMIALKALVARVCKPPSYVDLGLAVSELEGKTYSIQIFESPVGEEEAKAAFEPFSEEELFQETLQRLNTLQAKRDDLNWMGKKLFDALFKDATLNVLTRSLDFVKNEEKHLRLKLRLDAPELLSLPWELMHTAKLPPGFLVLNGKLSLARYIALEQPVTKPQFRVPLKILVLISRPLKLGRLDTNLEKKFIEKSLRPLRWAGDVQLKIRENASRDVLANELEKHPPDVLHYIGHSSFDAKKNKAFLALEVSDDETSGQSDNEERGYDELDSEELGGLLMASPVKLVVLNSCQGAATATTDAFIGIAQKLVQVGVPAVVAMQHEIPDPSAVRFARIFYSTLIKNYSIDDAVATARRYIADRVSLKKQDWATPVLFLRTKNGEVFLNA